MPFTPESVPASWGLTDPERGVRNLAAIRNSVTLAPYETIIALLDRYLPQSADADRALNNLERLLAVPAGRDRLPDLMAGDGKGLAEILAVLAASQFFADTLVSDPDCIDLARGGMVRSPSTAELTADLRSQADASRDDAGLLSAFRRFRRIQALRVGRTT